MPETAGIVDAGNAARMAAARAMSGGHACQYSLGPSVPAHGAQLPTPILSPLFRAALPLAGTLPPC